MFAFFGGDGEGMINLDTILMHNLRYEQRIESITIPGLPSISSEAKGFGGFERIEHVRNTHLKKPEFPNEKNRKSEYPNEKK